MFLITFGWDLNPNNKEGIANAPKWLDTTKFDILAKAGANVRVDKFASGNLINYEDLRNMVRAMLTERFQMKWHMEDRPVTAYTLIAVNPKLKPTRDPTERTKCKEGPGPDGKDPRIANPILNRLITCQNMTIAQIGDELQRVANGYIYNTVVDGTGLKGSYDFTLSFSSADKILPTPGRHCQQLRSQRCPLRLRRCQQTARPETRKDQASLPCPGYRSHGRDSSTEN